MLALLYPVLPCLQWGKDSAGGIGPPNAGMAQLGNIPAGTKVLLGFNEPNHVRPPLVCTMWCFCRA